MMDQGTHEAAPPIAWASDALRDVAAERRRQIEAEGWTPDHDDATHLPDELALAACCYCVADEGDAPPAVWPWDVKWWKPKDRRRNMVKAAALLLAAIEQRDRAADAHATWRAHDNDGMRYPEESDLVGGATDFPANSEGGDPD